VRKFPQKSRSHLKILGARTVACSNFPTEDHDDDDDDDDDNNNNNNNNF